MSRSGPGGEPPDEELARELRQRLGGEFRAEAEEGERLAAVARLRQRDLAAVAAELRDRGDRVRVATARRAFTGLVAEAGRDHLELRIPAGTVLIALERRPVHLCVVEPHVARPPPRAPPRATFRARLRELEVDPREVEVGADGLADALRGRLAAVAEDHLVVDDHDGGRWYVSWSGLAYVVVPHEG